MPPMVTYLAGDDGVATPEHIVHYEDAAGPGLIMVEGTAVLPEGRVDRRQLGIYRQSHVEGLATLAEVIHRSGAVAGIQLHHAGATAFAESRGRRAHRRLPPTLVRLARQQMGTAGLGKIRDAFRDAARRAVDAGFDIIEVHAAHGYVFSQFLSPLTNRRIDRYGGKLENRARLLIDVFTAVSEEVSGSALVTVRLGVADQDPRGLTLADGLWVARRLEDEGALLLSISHGRGTPPGPLDREECPYSSLLQLARSARSALRIPVTGGGGVRTPDLAERALQDGMADFIFVGRGMLADPGWARKALEGRQHEIVLCQVCSPCRWFDNRRLCPARRRAVDQ